MKNHAVAYLLKLCVPIVFGAKMTTSEHRSFAVERRKADRGDQSLGMSAALGRITALEKTLRNKFDDGFTKLCDRLDVIVEDDSGASVESIMAKQEVAALKPVGQDNTSITIATEELSNVV